MKYTVSKQDKGKIEIKVSVPSAAFGEAYGKVIGEMAATAKIAGFRPGNAPLDLVEGHVGANKVLNETATFLVSQHLGEIFKKEALSPIDSPKLAFDNLAKDTDFAFTVSFTQRPDITVGDWEKVKVAKVKPKDITEEDIEKSIENIYKAWVEREGSKGTKGTDGAEGEENKNAILDSKGNPVVSESKAEDKKVEGKPDDEFAKGVGARDLAHLKELVKKDLENIIAGQIETKYEEEIFEKLREVTIVEIPEVLVDDELNRMLVSLAEALAREGKDLKAALEAEKMTIDELKGKWRPQAEKNVKTALLVNKIGQDEKIAVTDAEVAEAMAKTAEQNMSSEQKADLQRYVAFNIFQAKTLDLIKKTVTAS